MNLVYTSKLLVRNLPQVGHVGRIPGTLYPQSLK